jgi:molecular chaperone HtpG
MDVSLNSYLEKRALAATKHPPFGVNLMEVKRTVAEILSQIGRQGIFESYSKHDITHIDQVLELADWLIDDHTKSVMSDADCFLITLSIYFHDMGMLVTSDEYKERARSLFPSFCQTTLYSGPNALEYKARIGELSADEAERFLYQEFVRHNHAKRVRDWIEGRVTLELGSAKTIVQEVQRVLAGLDGTLKKDLALVAESHHLDDLDDHKKYKPLQPYGGSDAETANLQFCALILRTADLLHMRKDRTPSVLFRLINPVDPISQREWAKQNAVRRVMARIGVNDDKLPDPSAPKDTIEVHAQFSDENGFFGLTQFLAYADKEVRRCFEWAERFQKRHGVRHAFPWKKVASDKIETSGFLPETFSFDLDQHRILDLLTGHTLYNDTNVVLRELAQNAIDAIRLHHGSDAEIAGRLQIEWNSTSRDLIVTDNGTGMTQDIVEKHLLKVGSSRYQDPRFIEQHPDFSAISRFGIGVLSAFMISDEVEITTSSTEELQARKMSLRSVHGRYLVRLLDKQTDLDAAKLGAHGTRVRLKVRQTARFDDVLNQVRQWIVIPKCKVTVSVDGAAPTPVGHSSAGGAVEAFLAASGRMAIGTLGRPLYKVVTKKADGVELAYAVQWSEYFRDWSVAWFTDRRETNAPPPCTCIEGIAVEFLTPGMLDRSIVAVANATGKGAPKTNVARSSLEATPERNALYSGIYGLYLEHVEDEIKRLIADEGFSLTWSVNSATSLVPGVGYGSSAGPVRPDLFRERTKELPICIVEENGTRNNVKFTDLLRRKHFWTVDCQLFRSAETVLGEAAGNATVSGILGALGDSKQILPEGVVLHNIARGMSLSQIVEDEFAPSEIRAMPNLRRIDVKWSTGMNDNWLRLSRHLDNLEARGGRKYRDIQRYVADKLRSGARGSLWLCGGGVTFQGIQSYAGVASSGRLFMRDGIELTRFFRELAKAPTGDEQSFVTLLVFSQLAIKVLDDGRQNAAGYVSSWMKKEFSETFSIPTTATEQFISVLESGPTAIFDTSVWRKRKVAGGPVSLADLEDE